MKVLLNDPEVLFICIERLTIQIWTRILRHTEIPSHCIFNNVLIFIMYAHYVPIRAILPETLVIARFLSFYL